MVVVEACFAVWVESVEGPDPDTRNPRFKTAIVLDVETAAQLADAPAEPPQRRPPPPNETLQASLGRKLEGYLLGKKFWVKVVERKERRDEGLQVCRVCLSDLVTYFFARAGYTNMDDVDRGRVRGQPGVRYFGRPGLEIMDLDEDGGELLTDEP